MVVKRSARVGAWTVWRSVRGRRLDRPPMAAVVVKEDRSAAVACERAAQAQAGGVAACYHTAIKRLTPYPPTVHLLSVNAQEEQGP
jgi:hypothetical protein